MGSLQYIEPKLTQTVTSMTFMEINPTLAKPPLNFDGSLANIRFTSFMKRLQLISAYKKIK